MTKQELLSRIDDLTRMADARIASCGLLELHPGDMLAPDERAEMHRLKMSLPTFAEERQMARDRIEQRLAARGRQHRR
ncbi:hypothetical protein KYK30_31370 [Shinella yambaruensis]|uniref:Uncharacterized protein n=1 Tax=Shinella yambaruensis TaxID=415996 RepID=A0ABQ5ZR73_9HYPH|nr:hypothetical protein [Shinella yambaruensis]MCJ8029978.1 hypothetical protein [Shinella yambaruensis]MCU7984224.1 hypothetical protein [Shinella yambaruensis]GLR55178.1 hypothetical protein GCM10007923_64000 [Shinella yambaruensis]